MTDPTRPPQEAPDAGAPTGRLARMHALLDAAEMPAGGTKAAETGDGNRPSRLLVILGLLIGAGLVALVSSQVSGGAGYLWNPVGLLIVLGGTAAATLIAFRPAQLRMVAQAVPILFRDDPSVQPELDRLMRVIRAYYRNDIRKAEREVEYVVDDFLRVGLQLALDNTPLDDILHTLNWRIQKLIEKETADARLFRTLAMFTPAFGMLGTLVGLIGMLEQLGTRDLGLIGAGMAVALVTTLYGLFFAYLVFRPIAIRIEQRTQHRVAMLNVMMQGVVLFRLGRPPAVIKDSLDTLMASYHDAFSPSEVRPNGGAA